AGALIPLAGHQRYRAALVTPGRQLVAHERPIANVVVATGTPALNHAVRNHAMERQAVIETIPYQTDEPRAGERRFTGKEPQVEHAAGVERHLGDYVFEQLG